MPAGGRALRSPALPSSGAVGAVENTLVLFIAFIGIAIAGLLGLALYGWRRRKEEPPPGVKPLKDDDDDWR